MPYSLDGFRVLHSPWLIGPGRSHVPRTSPVGRSTTFASIAITTTLWSDARRVLDPAVAHQEQLAAHSLLISSSSPPMLTHQPTATVLQSG